MIIIHDCNGLFLFALPLSLLAPVRSIFRWALVAGAICCWRSGYTINLFHVRANRIVFVDYVDGFSVDGKLDMYDTTTVVGGRCVFDLRITMTLVIFM